MAKPESSAFRTGTVALIDALGFRGIWGDKKAPDFRVFQTLEHVKNALDRKLQTLRRELKTMPVGWPNLNVTLQRHFMSDTLVIAASVDPQEQVSLPAHPQRLGETYTRAEYEAIRKDATRYIVRECAAAAMNGAALGPRPIAYRGVISCGEFVLSPPFIIGPAVDEAASLMGIADGAFVWFAPSARGTGRLVGDIASDALGVLHELQHGVPLKDGRVHAAVCVSPSASCRTISDAKHVRNLILGTMKSDRLDILIKRRNTAQFFDHIGSIEDAYVRRKRRAKMLQMRGQRARIRVAKPGEGKADVGRK